MWLGTRLTFVLDHKTVLIRRSSEIPEVGCYACRLLNGQPTSRLPKPQHQSVLAMIFWLQKAALQLYRRNVPLLHTSTHRLGTSLHVTSITRPSPTLVLQVTNTGLRRPGYESSFFLYASLQCSDVCTARFTIICIHRKVPFQLASAGAHKDSRHSLLKRPYNVKAVSYGEKVPVLVQ